MQWAESIGLGLPYRDRGGMKLQSVDGPRQRLGGLSINESGE